MTVAEHSVVVVTPVYEGVDAARCLFQESAKAPGPEVHVAVVEGTFERHPQTCNGT